jgi:type VI protein secretion system component VasK
MDLSRRAAHTGGFRDKQIESAKRIAMAGKLSGWMGVGVVAVTLFLVECVYRLAYWYWMTLLPKTDAALAWSRVHFWGGIGLFTGFIWICVVWREFLEGYRPKKKESANKKMESADKVTAGR